MNFLKPQKNPFYLLKIKKIFQNFKKNKHFRHFYSKLLVFTSSLSVLIKKNISTVLALSTLFLHLFSLLFLLKFSIKTLKTPKSAENDPQKCRKIPESAELKQQK